MILNSLGKHYWYRLRHNYRAVGLFHRSIESEE
jgi:hypothetical protein